MFRTVMVPLDGSELSERALPYAATLAATAKGEMILVRVALAPPPARLDGLGWESAQLDAVNEAEAYLARIAQRMRPEIGVKTTAPYGRAPQQLLETIRQYGADAVVMATHGRTGLAHVLHGSVAEALLANSPVPIFLVHARPGRAAAAAFSPLVTRALVPLDGSAFAEHALDTAAKLVGPTGEIALVRVVEPPDNVEYDENGRVLAYLDQQEEARTREARMYLSNVATQLHARYPAIRAVNDVRIGEPIDGIVLSARARGVGLVVMATHGRTGLRRAAVGSVAGGVVRTASVPVILVGPHQAEHSADMVSVGAPLT